MPSPYRRITDLNPGFADTYKMLSGKEKLTLDRMLYGINDGAPPLVHKVDESGRFVFLSDDKEQTLIFDPKRNSEGSLDIEVWKGESGFYSGPGPKMGIGSKGPSAGIGGEAGVIRASKTDIVLDPNGSATGRELEVDVLKVSGGIQPDKVGVTVTGADVEGKIWRLTEPEGQLNSTTGDLEIVQYQEGVSGSLGLKVEYKVELGSDSSVSMGPGSLGIVAGKEDLSGHGGEISPEAMNAFKIEALEKRKAELDSFEGVPRPGSVEHQEQAAQIVADEKAQIDAQLKDAYEERAVYASDAATEAGEEIDGYIDGAQNEIDNPQEGVGENADSLKDDIGAPEPNPQRIEPEPENTATDATDPAASQTPGVAGVGEDADSLKDDIGAPDGQARNEAGETAAPATTAPDDGAEPYAPGEVPSSVEDQVGGPAAVGTVDAVEPVDIESTLAAIQASVARLAANIS